MPTRTLSSDSMTLHSMTQYDQMDPEIRAQIQSNIHVLYEPSLAPHIHIATCRGHDGAYLAFLVNKDNLAKAITNPNAIASEPKSTRSAAMLSLLEATEQRIAEVLIKTNHTREQSKKNPVPPQPPPAPAEQKIVNISTEKVLVDYGEKPKEKGFMPWKKNHRVESAYARQVCN